MVVRIITALNAYHALRQGNSPGALCIGGQRRKRHRRGLARVPVVILRMNEGPDFIDLGTLAAHRGVGDLRHIAFRTARFICGLMGQYLQSEENMAGDTKNDILIEQLEEALENLKAQYPKYRWSPVARRLYLKELQEELEKDIEIAKNKK